MSNPFGFEPTAQQSAILEAAERGESLVMEAAAGAAKSTTILLIAKRLVEAHNMDRMVYLCFNTAAAEKAKQQVAALGLSEQLSVKTAHSLAWSAAGYKYKTRVSGDGHIALAGALDASDAFARFAPGDPFAFSVAVVDLLSRYCASKDREIGIEHLPPITAEDGINPEALLEAASEVWPKLVNPSGDLPLFHDVYLKLYSLSEVPIRFKVLFFDEAQDANGCMFAFTERQRKLQRVYSGDSNQSIYAFRHAIDALSLLNLPRYPLTHSFRFGPNIAAYVNRLLEKKGAKLRVVGAAADPGRVTTQGSVTSADVLLARTNVGMFEAALTAIQRPEIKGITFPGFKKHTDLLLAAHELYSGRTCKHQTIGRFRNWNDLVVASKSEQASMLAPYVRLVNEHTDEVPTLVKRLEEQQRPPSKGGLRLSTVHGLKGDEDDTVRLVSDFQPILRDGELDVEESNLWYVAFTRARKVLDLGGAAQVVTAVLGEPTITMMAAASATELTLEIASTPPAQASAENAETPAQPAVSESTGAPRPAPAAAPMPEPPITRTVKSPAASLLDLLADPSPESAQLAAQAPAPIAATAPAPPSSQYATLPSVVAAPMKPRPATVPTPLLVPVHERYRAARAGARRTATGWFAPIGTDLNRCASWIPKQRDRALSAQRVFGQPQLTPTGEAKWLVGPTWVESVGSYSALRARRALNRIQGGKCAICGARSTLEAHVVIGYGGTVATMTDLIGLCKLCHQSQHLERGIDEKALTPHLMRVNKESEATSLLRLKLAKDELYRRNEQWYLLQIADGFPPALHSPRVSGTESWTSRLRDSAARFMQAPRTQFLRWFVAGAAQPE